MALATANRIHATTKKAAVAVITAILVLKVTIT
jgi:hypothetical protein